jgi:hypothetical protein
MMATLWMSWSASLQGEYKVCKNSRRSATKPLFTAALKCKEDIKSKQACVRQTMLCCMADAGKRRKKWNVVIVVLQRGQARDRENRAVPDEETKLLIIAQFLILYSLHVEDNSSPIIGFI